MACNDVSVCGQCETQINPRSACISCCLCVTWFHKGCSGLANKDFNKHAQMWKKSRKNEWACSACRSEVMIGDVNDTPLPNSPKVGENQEISVLLNKKELSVRESASVQSQLYELILSQNNTIQQMLMEIKRLNEDRNKLLSLVNDVKLLKDELVNLKQTAATTSLP